MPKDLLSVITTVAPEIRELVERRYAILQTVFFAQPVGRRTLAGRLKCPERTVRNEVDFLRREGFLESHAAGIVISSAGEEMLDMLKDAVRSLHGLADLEKNLSEKLELAKVYVVAGNSDAEAAVKKEMARVAADHLVSVLQDGDVLAVSGGSTMAEVAAHLPETSPHFDEVIVVPSGGGLGDTLEIEANTIAAMVARGLGGEYRLLHVPDDLDEEAVNVLTTKPSIRELFALIRSAKVVMQGIGTLEAVVRRRKFSDQLKAELISKEAVGETLGYYFDRDGNIVHSTGFGVGLRPKDLERVEQVIAVAGGHSKGEAALAVLSAHYQNVLIIDEAAATEMLACLDAPATT